MYNQFFALRENPFNVNPDPRFLFLNRQTQQALDGLIYGIKARKGLLLLTGEVGTGKTTLLNHVLAWLEQQRTPAAFIFNSHLEVSHLFDFVLKDFAVKFDATLKDNTLLRLQQWLLESFRAGRTPVLIVDEAQGLADHVLEEIRMLLNMETCSEKLLQIVLAGQPELDDRLQQPALCQVKQRIALRCQTAPLSRHETHKYIETRLHIAGADGKPIFASQSMDAAYFYSRGIPRVMNLLCEHALLNASVEQIRPVPPHLVAEVARQFQFDGIKPLASSSSSAVAPRATDSPAISARDRFINALTSLTAAPDPGEMTEPVVQRWAGLPDNILGPLPQVAAPEQTQSHSKFFVDWTKFFAEVGSKLTAEQTIESSRQQKQQQEPAIDPGQEPTTAADQQAAPDPEALTESTFQSPAAKSAHHRARRMSPNALRLLLVRWAAQWTNSLGAASITIACAQPPATLLQLPNQLWLAASTWLRQPCDPTQWRLPDVHPFHEDLRFHDKKM
jgi:general secretion pathway protein A